MTTGESRRAWLARAGFILLFTLVFATAGCGIITYERTVFPQQYTDAEGNLIRLDDINAIMNDPELNNDQRRTALRELGIEDEDVLDIIMSSF